MDSRSTARPTIPLSDQFFAIARNCAEHGAPLYAHLLRQAGEEIASGGALAVLLQPFAEEPFRRMFPLRLMSLVHRWVLAGELPELAAHYPSAGGTLPPEGAWPLFRDACLARRDQLRWQLPQRHQHNQVARAGALLGGLLWVARMTDRPLWLLEVGSSAGLLLRTDRYRDSWWLPRVFEVAPPLDGWLEVVGRQGCDPDPIDPTTPEGTLTLRSAIWADLVDHLRMLDEAIEICRRVPAQVERADGADWLPDRLAQRPAQATTVVFHSMTLGQMAQLSRERMLAALHRAGAEATAGSPLAWLRLEVGQGPTSSPGAPLAELRLALWPGGEDRLLATSDTNGMGTRWLA
jgi:hypothetical protein